MSRLCESEAPHQLKNPLFFQKHKPLNQQSLKYPKITPKISQPQLTNPPKLPILRVPNRSLTVAHSDPVNQAKYGGETASTGTKKRWLHAECLSTRTLDRT
jgi:hypothetical protein